MFVFLRQAAMSTAVLQLNTVMDGGGPPRDDMRIPVGGVDTLPKQTVRCCSTINSSNQGFFLRFSGR